MGTPLFTDKMTANRERLTFARVCVEIEVEKALPETIPIKGTNNVVTQQRVEYEWVPIWCKVLQSVWTQG